ncbi:MAG: hypothetical protein HYT46_03230 [Candidatus Vogelbacteria bacterium]|nr:hypothetical protein [Candidatus Vogelbacteria bacterium]
MKINRFLTIGVLALILLMPPVLTKAQTPLNTVGTLQIQTLQLQEQLIEMFRGRPPKPVRRPCGLRSGYHPITGLPCPNFGTSTAAVAPSIFVISPEAEVLELDCGVNDCPNIMNQLFVLVNALQQQQLAAQRLPAPAITPSLVLPPSSSPSTPAITVVSPNGGESWQIGRTYPIKWKTSDKYASSNVQIGLKGSPPSTEGPEVTLVFTMPNTGEYLWTIPSTLSNWVGRDVFIVVYIHGAGIADTSDKAFRIAVDSVPNLPPSISGVSGPTVLNVGQSGTWSVTASDPENGPLSYSVVWGDEGGTTAGSPTVQQIQQTATFTHTYSQAGTYYPTFTVTDNAGQPAKTSLSVVVTGTGLAQLKVLWPNGDETLNTGQEYKIQWVPHTDIPTQAGKVDIWLLDHPTRLGRVIFSGIPNDGTEYWFAKPLDSLIDPRTGNKITPSGNYVIFINCSDNSCIVDDSDRPFKIGGSIPTPIPTIISSYPPDGAIDAAEATLLSAVRGELPWGSVGLTFSGLLPTSGSLLDYFSISSSNAAGAPAVSQVRWANANNYAVSFSRQILPGERIRITHKPSNTSICLGFLPGDVDQDGWALARDIGLLNAWVGTAAGASQPLYKTDINRDGVFNAADVTRAGEILSAPDAIRSLPACPQPLAGQAGAQSQLANALSALSSLLQTLQQSLGR